MRCACAVLCAVLALCLRCACAVLALCLRCACAVLALCLRCVVCCAFPRRPCSASSAGFSGSGAATFGFSSGTAFASIFGTISAFAAAFGTAFALAFGAADSLPVFPLARSFGVLSVLRGDAASLGLSFGRPADFLGIVEPENASVFLFFAKNKSIELHERFTYSARMCLGYVKVR
jgi:hypothetical protein